jgi:hypothetical protein
MGSGDFDTRKASIEREILARLSDIIDNELSCMESYTDCEIASEVLCVCSEAVLTSKGV